MRQEPEEFIIGSDAIPMKEEKLIVPAKSAQHGSLENALTANIEHEDNIKSVAKQLFSKEDVEVRTRVSKNEINNLARVAFMQTLAPNVMVKEAINHWQKLRISLDGKSREEFIRALQTENQNAQGTGMMGRLKTMFGGGNSAG